MVILYQDWQKQGKIEHTIFSPEEFWVLNEHEILVNDRSADDAPIRRIHFVQDTVINVLRTGRGPGEVSDIYYKGFTRYNNGNLLLWDAGQKRVTIYDNELNYMTDIRFFAGHNNFYQVFLANDSTLITVDNSRFFLKAWRLKDNRVDKEHIIWQHSIDEFSELAALENFIMLQTMYYTNRDDVLYIAFEYSSLIMAIDENGIKYITDGPERIPIPNPKVDGRYSLPIMGKHPEGARDITVDDAFVYVVFSGKNVSRFEQMRYTFNFEELIEKVKHANRLWMFNKTNGEFVKEVTLPIQTKRFQVYGDYVYLLNTIKGNPKIIKYRAPDDL